jgi:hypothetical protein
MIRIAFEQSQRRSVRGDHQVSRPRDSRRIGRTWMVGLGRTLENREAELHQLSKPPKMADVFEHK